MPSLLTGLLMLTRGVFASFDDFSVALKAVLFICRV